MNVHTLYVGFAGSPTGAASEDRLVALENAIRQTWEFQRASAAKEVALLQKGDGMAAVFTKDPISPVQCAVELAWASERQTDLAIRMGIHSGPVSYYGGDQYKGPAIDLAASIMKYGDAGHVLMSSQSAEAVSKFGTWSDCVHNLDMRKSGISGAGTVVNFYKTGVGNANNPSCMGPSEVPAAEKAPAKPKIQASVCLVFDRLAFEDKQVADMLAGELGRRGADILGSRSESVGLRWSDEFERKLQAADAVIAVVSDSSQYSEMLEYELTSLQNVVSKRGGKPRVLPVRIGSGGLLREPMASLLNSFPYTVWTSPNDNSRVVEDLENALASQEEQSVRPRSTRPIGGALPLDSELYVRRSTDDEFIQALNGQDSIVLVKGARQMGKTSLLARGLQDARNRGSKVVLTDFQTLEASHFESPDVLYRMLALTIADQLDLDVDVEQNWIAEQGANMNLERFIRRTVLGSIEGQLVWGMDEVDRLFSCPFGSEVFGLLRSWHNRRSLDPTGPWSRLTLAIAYATEAQLFITDLNQSPFNVGTRLALEDFSWSQVGDLNQRHGSPLNNDNEVQRFVNLVGGQPYLVNRGLAEMAGAQIPIGGLESGADKDDGIFGDHLRRILVTLSQDEEMVEVVRGIILGGECPTPESFFRLRSGGIISGGSMHEPKMRCHLYERFLARHIV